jgi:hypothetical protein
MSTTQGKQVAMLADIRDEQYYKWKKMKSKRDARNNELENRKKRDEALHEINRIVIEADKQELYRACREQLAHQEYGARSKFQQISAEQKRLRNNLLTRMETKRKQQQAEGKLMREVLKEAAQRTKEYHRDEMMQYRAWREFSGSVSHSSMRFSDHSSSIVSIPDTLKDKVKSARRSVT